MYKRLLIRCCALIIILGLILAFFLKPFDHNESEKYPVDQSYGLGFNSHESLLEKRTSLELASGTPLYFSGSFRLEFDMNFIIGYQRYFGYILRIINRNQNIDLIYDPGASLFRLIVGQRFSGISFTLDSVTHLFTHWNRLSILVEPEKQAILLSVNNKVIGKAPISVKGNDFKFLWGANDDESFRTRDVPPMQIREIRIFEGKKLSYYWPLDECSGNITLDEIHQKEAIVKNGNWIKPRHQNWSLLGSFVLAGNAVTAFDAKRERLFLAGSDSVFIYEMKNIPDPWTKLPVRHEAIQMGSQAIYDTFADRLYDVFIDQKKIAFWSIRNQQWDKPFSDTLFTRNLHANKFISSRDTTLYMIGGYGLQRYKNLVQSYHIPTKKWDTLTTGGDFFPPRYLAALGTTPGGDTAYIIGGYGSFSGNQMLNPGNYYDMFAFDVKSKSFKKLFDLDSAHFSFVFANSLIIDVTGQKYYGLIFPNDRFDSHLQLITGSLKNPSFSLLGNQIPFSFYDLQSFVDLYYSPSAGKIIAVTLFYSKPEATDKFTVVKIYSIDFPPGLFTNVSPQAGGKTGTKYFLLLLIIIIVSLLSGGFFLFKRKKLLFSPAIIVSSSEWETSEKELSPGLNETAIMEESTPQSRILLFGQFQVWDKTGNDITELFTPLLKELFLLILLNTVRGRGISSNELTEILWNGKSIKDAKNNRSVNLAKLKNILERVGNYMLIKESGFWKFRVVEESIYIDYEKYADLLQNNRPEIKETECMKKLLEITGNGSFLFQTEYDWLDDIKSEVSNAIIDTCLLFINSKQENLDPEFIIDITNCVFHFDQLNENALEYKCRSLILLKRHLLANKAYARFCKDYKNIYGEEFSRSFNDIIKEDPASPQV